jgi:hypothetical protein
MTEGAESVFPPETMRVVYQHSRGIPRLMNTLCENALITAFARQERSVTPEMIREISAEFRLNYESDKVCSETDGQEQRAAARTLLQMLESSQQLRTPAKSNALS